MASARTPRSIEASTVRLSARVPARWPAATGRPRWRAQRPFPSMMIATDCATSGSSGPARGRTRLSVRIRVRRFTEGSEVPASDLHDLRFFVFQQLVDRRGVLVGELLPLLLRAPLLVVADVAVLDELLQMVHQVAADVPDRDPALLRVPAHELDELLAPLLGQLRDRQADYLAVVRRLEPELGLQDRLLDRLDLGRVERLHCEEARLRRVDRRHLLQRRLLAVVVDLDAVEQGRRGASRADAVELGTGRLDRLVHPPRGVLQQLVYLRHQFFPPVDMIVLTRSPSTMRRINHVSPCAPFFGLVVTIRSQMSR